MFPRTVPTDDPHTTWQVSFGLPYTPGADAVPRVKPVKLAAKPAADRPPKPPCMRLLVAALLGHRKKLVLHNGLMDLMFLYHSFYAPLPPTLDTFVADLADLLRGGLVDTKYVADFVAHEKSSYLSFLFHSSQRLVAGADPSHSTLYSPCRSVFSRFGAGSDGNSRSFFL